MHRSSKPTVAIIGSGLAGSLLAERLSSKFSVTVFERGSAKTSIPQDVIFTGQPRGLAPPLRYGLGGTTSLWAGGLMQFLQTEFNKHWPHQAIAKIQKYNNDVLRALGDKDVLDQWRDTAPQSLDQESTLIGMYMPKTPFRGLQSAPANDFDLRTQTQVVAVEENASQAVVHIKHHSSTISETFDNVIVSAGALQSPILLQASGLGGSEIGQNLTDHPMGFIAKLYHPEPNDLVEKLTDNGRKNRVRHCVKIKDDVTGLTTAFYLRAALGGEIIDDPYFTTCQVVKEKGRLKRNISAIKHLKSRDFLTQAIEHQFSYRIPSQHSYVLAVSEQEATGQGYISSSANGSSLCNWTISSTSEDAILRNARRFADICSGDLILPEGPIRSRLFSSAHLSGTCRITKDNEKGGVDANLAVRGTERIFVCDGSVLPSTGATNTGLTIGALSFALAEHISNQYAHTLVPEYA